MSKMLSSWKEIAQYFGKGVRTVQRWEKTLALPIYRPPGAPSNVVLARTNDLEAWMNRGPAERAAVQNAGRVNEADLEGAVTDLEREVIALRSHLGLHPVQSSSKAISIDEDEAAQDIVARIRLASDQLRELQHHIGQDSIAA